MTAASAGSAEQYPAIATTPRTTPVNCARMRIPHFIPDDLLPDLLSTMGIVTDLAGRRAPTGRFSRTFRSPHPGSGWHCNHGPRSVDLVPAQPVGIHGHHQAAFG